MIRRRLRWRRFFWTCRVRFHDRLGRLLDDPHALDTLTRVVLIAALAVIAFNLFRLGKGF